MSELESKTPTAGEGWASRMICGISEDCPAIILGDGEITCGDVDCRTCGPRLAKAYDLGRESVQVINQTLLAACKVQHDAIDTLFARLIGFDESFRPSQSGKLWEAILQGNAAIAEATRK